MTGRRVKQEKPRGGRPPRTDRPIRVGFILPGELRDWAHAQAMREGRAQGDVLAAALVLYRKHVTRRKP